MNVGPAPVPAFEAYRRWAATYDEEENPVHALDERAVRLLTPPLAGLDLLDAACGTARRLVFADPPRRAVGFDLVLEMVAAGRRRPERSRATAVADLLAMPFPSASCDVVWCRIAAGYVRDLAALYREIARVLRPEGCAIVTDFHPAAARAGHRRTFHDAAGREVAMAHTVHGAEEHEAAAARALLARDARLEIAVGPEVRPLYERAGALARYERDCGLPLVLAFRFVARSASRIQPQITSG